MLFRQKKLRKCVRLIERNAVYYKDGRRRCISQGITISAVCSRRRRFIDENLWMELFLLVFI